MQLNRIVLPILDVDNAARFYRTTLGLPVQIATGSVTVTVGPTQLELHAAEEVIGFYHLAMTIPSDTFVAARSWLEDRAPLLRREGNVEGEDEFEGPPGWNSRSLYFDGPEGAVLELIERRDLPPGRSSTFSTKELVCISEVGIAVPDVEQAASLLRQSAGIDTYGGPASPDFAAAGDVHGLLILVRPGRTWLPTTDRHAEVAPITVEVAGPRPATYTLGAATVHVTG